MIGNITACDQYRRQEVCDGGIGYGTTCDASPCICICKRQFKMSLFVCSPLHLVIVLLHLDTARTGDKYETSSINSGYSKSMKLRIRNVELVDYGSYRCVAKNSLGETNGLIKLEGITCMNEYDGNMQFVSFSFMVLTLPFYRSIQFYL